ncbi:MAG: pyridoxal 5'-phosphate synthase glutaminase subunit PdxT [Xanthomonadaceae bacterium]|jgi:5'-phosphate synthase pdxT subunit|nr:pyridoxal 5'-phosphate synthase glutaminase subunit PdxT [Xanthomonadaceae bacterium]
MKIGVLALQGAFAEHLKALRRLGVQGREIRQLSDFTDDLDGIVLPGGESTVIGKLMENLGLLQPLRQAIHAGLPVFGTCAGMILLAKEVDGSDISYIAAMDARVRRNAYGRQLGSFGAVAPFAGIGDIPMVFIRAPYIESIWGDAEILATVDGRIVAAKQRHILTTAFHPELTENTSVHEYFLTMIGQPSTAYPDVFPPPADRAGPVLAQR